MLNLFNGDEPVELPETDDPGRVFCRAYGGVVAAVDLLPSILIACPVVSIVQESLPGTVQREAWDNDVYLTADWVFDIPHSCQPNVEVIDAAERIMVRPLRLIPAGERIVRFFPSTEWMIHNMVHCHCGQPGCIRALYGAVSLTLDHFTNRPVAPWIRRKLTLKRVYGLK